MLRITTLAGQATDPHIAERLHELEHRGQVETVVLSRGDMSRRRQQISSDRGTQMALMLDRDAVLGSGSVLVLEATRAIVVLLDEPQYLVLRTDSPARALELGYFAGNMHWKVKFEGAALFISLEGLRSDYLARLNHLLEAGDVHVDPEAKAVSARSHAHAHTHNHDPAVSHAH